MKPFIRRALARLLSSAFVNLSSSAISRVAGSLALAGTLAGCTAVPTKSISDRVDQLRSFRRRVYVLDFNNDGILANPTVLGAAVDEISASRRDATPEHPAVRKILVLSYGWSHDRDAAVDHYYEEAVAYLRSAGQIAPESNAKPNPFPEPINFGEWAVVCISWNSGDNAVGTALKDIVPGPQLADVVGSIPRYALFPFTYWSKARLADNIGYHGLNEALTYLIENGFGTAPAAAPELYLIGHSFGCRILAALTKKDLGSFPLSLPRQIAYRANGQRSYDIPFRYEKDVRGVVFLQPALTRFNLPEEECKYQYPVIVTQSRHDHANGFLYPVANTLLNSYAFTGQTAYVDQVFPDSPNPIHTAVKQTSVFVSALAFTAVALPTNYLWTQGHLLVRRNVNYIADTLAQIPLIEAPVWALDAALHGKANLQWGTKSKGLFELGAPFESAGRLTSVAIGNTPQPRSYSVEEAQQLLQRGYKGLMYVDESSRISHSAFGQAIDLQNPALDFTVGWFDPIGAHSDYGPAYGLITSILAQDSERRFGAVAPRVPTELAFHTALPTDRQTGFEQ